MTHRTLAMALIVSAALNLFVIGGAVGAVAMWLHAGRPAPAAPARGSPIVRAADALAPEQRQAFRAQIRAVLQQSRPLVQAARQDRQEAARLFVQPQFDQAAVSAALGRARQADFELRTRLEAAVVGFAAQLPQAQRQLLAERMRRAGPLRQPRRAQAPPAASPQQP